MSLPNNPRPEVVGPREPTIPVGESPTDSHAADNAPTGLPAQVTPNRQGILGRRGLLMALVICGVLAIVLAVGCVVAEKIAQQRIEQAVWTALPGLSKDAKVATPTPLIPELLDSHVSTVSIDASTVVLSGQDGASMTLKHPHIELTDVSTDAPHHVAALRATAVVPWSVVEDTASREHPMLPGATFTPTEDGTVWALTPIHDSGLELRPSVKDSRTIHLAIVGATVGGHEFPLQAALALMGMDSGGMDVDMSMLPEGTQVTTVTVGDDGMHVVIEGRDLDLDAMNKPT